MAICVGDTVRFLNDVGGGRVTRIKDKTAYVLIDEGFEVPVNVSQLVIINKNSDSTKSDTKKDEKIQTKKFTDFQINYNYSEREENSFEEEFEEDKLTDNKKYSSDKTIKEFKKSTSKQDDKFFIAFVPEKGKKDGEEGVSLYLINDSEFSLLYSIGICEGDEHALLDAGQADSYEKINISRIAKESYPALKSITVQAIKFKKGIYNSENVIDEELKIKSFKLLNNSSFKDNEYFDFSAWLIQLETQFTDEEKEKPTFKNISDILLEKEIVEPDLSKKFKKRPEPVLIEVDLHINQLVDQIKGMSNSEMLEIQLGKFRSELENAIQDKTINQIVFIHGIGNGTLKMALRKQLDDLYKHLQYHDASFQEYGYGATLVIIRR
ncbi:MAG: DUF2027 domain-containing protein [Bacteroidia bacterium]|nr:DUF2027 domain-containing protein [Bacteroidia bacterium]